MKNLIKATIYLIFLANVDIKSSFINTIVLQNKKTGNKVILYGNLCIKDNALQNQNNLINKNLIKLEDSKSDFKIINFTTKYFVAEKIDDLKLNYTKNVKAYEEAKEIIELINKLNKQKKDIINQRNKTMLDLESAFDDLSLFTSLEMLDPNININQRIKISYNKKKLEDELVKIENQIKNYEKSFLLKFNLNLYQALEVFSKILTNQDLLNQDNKLEKINFGESNKIIIFSDYKQIAELAKNLLSKDFELVYNSEIKIKFKSGECMNVDGIIVDLESILNKVEKNIILPIQDTDFDFITNN